MKKGRRLSPDLVDKLRSLQLEVQASSEDELPAAWKRFTAALIACRAAECTNETLGAALGVSGQTVSNWLRADAPPRRQTLPRRPPRKKTYPVRDRITDQELTELQDLWTRAAKRRRCTPADHPDRTAIVEFHKRALEITVQREVSLSDLSIALGYAWNTLTQRLRRNGELPSYAGRPSVADFEESDRGSPLQ